MSVTYRCNVERENSPKNDNESSDIFRCSELLVRSSHDKSNNTLRKHAPCEGLLGTNPVTQKGTCYGSGEVEGVGKNRPSETLPERSGVANDDVQPFG